MIARNRIPRPVDPPAAAGPDLLHGVQLAAHRFAAAAGTLAARVVILDDDGRKVLDTRVPAAVEPADPPAGWTFAGRLPKFDGGPVPVAGRKLDVLKALAQAPGPLSVDELRRAAWDGAEVEESSVRWYVAELRKTLRAAFPGFEGDPLPATPGGYVLAIR